MTATLDYRRVQGSTPVQLRDYYNQLKGHSSNDLITTQLLQAIERGLISPLTFAPWLGVSKSPTTILEALKQNKSVLVRKLAINQLRKVLCSSRWRETWDGIGSTRGVLEILSDLSVLEVKELCKAFGRCAKGKDVAEKRECFTELFQGLHPIFFPDAKHTTTDRRPLAKHYRLLAPACLEDLIDEAITSGLEGAWQHTRERDLLRYHPESMRRAQLQSLSTAQSIMVEQQNLDVLIKQYPSATTSVPGFSASMEFALTVLRRLAESEIYKVEDTFFIHNLVRPLLKRAVRKRAKFAKVQEITDLTMQYLEAHPTAGNEITTTIDDVHHLIAQSWSRKPHLFDKQLRRLCSHPVFGTSTYDKISDWDCFLERISPPRRYQLLRLVVQESTGLDLDVNQDLQKVKGVLTLDLLNNLGEGPALSLFARLRKARGDVGLVEIGNSSSILRSSSTFRSSSTYGKLDGDTELYHIALQSRNSNHDEAERLATTYMERRRKNATSASQPERRGFYALSVLYAVVACGSLSMLQDTIQWTKRFLRDPLTWKDIYPRWYPVEMVRSLSGIPEPLDNTLSMSDLRQRVEITNSILADMFDIACAALQEPSFSMDTWRGTLDLFRRVVRERISLSPKLIKVLNVSDKEIYDTLWEATIPMLVSVERKVNQEGLERLEAHGLLGVLGEIEINLEIGSALTFIDNLAQARDELWREMRPNFYPATAALPAPFPRGLPIQHLTASWVLNVQLEKNAPYLASRVNATLFPSPAALELVPTDEESQKAIGVFVDSYQHAMQLYVPKCTSKNEREERVQKVWEYAIGPLSHGRMSEEEASWYWRNLKLWLVEDPSSKKDVSSSDQRWPSIPEVDNPMAPSEWNPFSSGRPDMPARDLGKPTYIDLSVAVHDHTSSKPGVHDKLDELYVGSEVQAYKVDRNMIWDSSRKIGEGGVLAALLYIDTKFRSKDNRLLETSFPRQNDVDDANEIRYPSLYLDNEFLSSEELNPFTAVRNVHGHLDLIPPMLLWQLASNVINALEAADSAASTYATIQEVAMQLVIRLGESDRPSLAGGLAICTILEKPKLSSWHRQLFKPRFLRSLSATEARQIFENLAEQILDRLQTQDNAHKELNVMEALTQSDLGQRERDDKSSSRPFVKVTTLKFLAQLLNGTDFVDEDFAFSTLSTLSQKAMHVDVRLNIVRSFLEMLNSGSVERGSSILAVLEPITSIAGSLNEREPLAESNWTQFEDRLSLPEMQEGIGRVLDTSSPILFALIVHYREALGDVEKIRAFVERILLPTVEHLKQQTARWVALFLRRHGIDDAAQRELKVPSIPRDASISQSLLSADAARVCHIPRVVLEEYVAHIIFNIAPPAPIRTLIKKLRDDPTVKWHPDVQTWLRLYAQGINAVEYVAIFDFLSLLGTETKLSGDAGITPRIVHEQFLKLFTAVLWNDSISYKNLLNFLAHDILSGKYLVKPWWQPYGKSIVEAMIACVNKIRTRDWERDSARKPAVLPDTFSWRLLLLDYPWPNRNDNNDDRDNRCKVFAAQLAAIINEISGSLYHKKLDQLKSYLALDPVSSTKNRSTNKTISNRTLTYTKRDQLHDALVDNRVSTAVYLGDITKTMLSWLTAPELLKVEIAAYLVSMASEEFENVDKVLKERLKGLLDSWKRCENEEVRRTGYLLVEKHYDLA